MKTSHVSDRSRTEPDGKNRVSWNKDPQAQMLRVEFADGSFLLLPYGHLNIVRYEQRSEADLLTVHFASHEIQITGKHLRELGLTFQNLAVDWVKELPTRYAAIANHDNVQIATIKIIEIQAQQ
jgi:hypothetical protein